MPFTCPDCQASGFLRVTDRLDFPPDRRADEISLQVVDCCDCGFSGIVAYQEPRHGTADEQSFEHTGYRVSPDELERVRGAIRQCPQPANWHCLCRAHRTYGTKNASGQWNGLSNIQVQSTFELQPSAA